MTSSIIPSVVHRSLRLFQRSRPYLITCTHLYSCLNWSNGEWKNLPRVFDMVAQNLNGDFVSREFDDLTTAPLCHCASTVSCCDPFQNTDKSILYVTYRLLGLAFVEHLQEFYRTINYPMKTTKSFILM